MQFALRIAFGCVLHRCSCQDIHRNELCDCSTRTEQRGYGREERLAGSLALPTSLLLGVDATRARAHTKRVCVRGARVPRWSAGAGCGAPRGTPTGTRDARGEREREERRERGEERGRSPPSVRPPPPLFSRRPARARHPRSRVCATFHVGGLETVRTVRVKER